MVQLNRDALVCDLAETYGILNMRALPLRLLATLVSGLRENSRIRMAVSGDKLPLQEMLSAAMLDRLSLLWWAQTEDGQKNRNRPQMVLDSILGQEKEQALETFETAEDFDKAWKKAAGGE